MKNINKYVEILTEFATQKLKPSFDIDKLHFENFEIVNSYLINQTIKDKKKKENTLIYIPNKSTKSQFYLPVIFTIAIYNFRDNYIDNITDFAPKKNIQKNGQRYRIDRIVNNLYELIKDEQNRTRYVINRKAIEKYLITTGVNITNRQLKLKFDLYKSFFSNIIKEEIDFFPSEFKYKSIIVTDKNIVDELKKYEIEGEKIHKAFPFQYVAKSGVKTDNIPIDPMIYIVNDYETARKYILDKDIAIRNITFIGQNKYNDYHLEISEDLNNNRIENCLFIGSSDISENAIPNLLKWNWTLAELDYFNYFESHSINKISVDNEQFSTQVKEFNSLIKQIEEENGINLQELYKFLRNILPIIIPSSKSRLLSQLNNTLIYFQKEAEDIIETALDEIGEYDYENIWMEILEKFIKIVDCKKNCRLKILKIKEFQKIDYLIVPKEYLEIWREETDRHKILNVISFKEFNQLETKNKTIVFLGFFGYNHLKLMMYNSNKISIILNLQEEEYYNNCFNNLKRETYKELKSPNRKHISGISYIETEQIENIDELIKRLFEQDENIRVNPDYSESYAANIYRKLTFENDTESLELDENKTVLLKINQKERFEKVKNLSEGDKIRVYDNSSKEELYKVALEFDTDGEFIKIETYSTLWKTELKKYYCKFQSLEELHQHLIKSGLTIKNEHTLNNWINPNSSVKFPQRRKDLSVLKKTINSDVFNENYNDIFKYRIGYNRIMKSLGRKFSSEISDYIQNKKKGKLLKQFSEKQIQQFVDQNAKERTIKTIKAIEYE